MDHQALKTPPEEVAAVDLGSNSFHLVIYRTGGDHPVVIERLRDQVQLRAGLDAEGRITDAAQARALEAIDRFAQLVRPRPGLVVRVAATNTFRTARNADAFRERVAERLGYPVEVISGEEEARLIDLGVAQSVPVEESTRRLVVDIGGGSTECILGRGPRVLDARSYEMGCVAWSERFFKNGRIEKVAFDAARAAASAVLEPLAREWNDEGARVVIGASGTIRATERILRALGHCTHGVTREGLKRTIKRVLKARSLEVPGLPGLKRSRVSVYPGGLAILDAVFQAFDVDRMEVSDGALREGIVQDLLGAEVGRDARRESLRALEARYFVDREQAARVQALALGLHAQVAAAWGLDDGDAEEALGHAARLHEIGLALSHRHFHLHGAYLLANASMPGFGARDRAQLAAIVGGLRGRLDQPPFRRVQGIEDASSVWFDSLAPFVGSLMDEGSVEKERALRLAMLLRIAALLCRDRAPAEPPACAARARDRAFELEVPAEWLAHRAATAKDLAREGSLFRTAGYTFTVLLEERDGATTPLHP